LSSLQFAGVRFSLYPDDHLPLHVHASYAGVRAILELHADGSVTLARRYRSVQPMNASRSDVRKILRTANRHFASIIAAWETMHP